ncbi:MULTISPECIES: Gfo/Idh/MocA family oxidoreductase [unclassified Paenibacillus]|uniref:Gfo/Idh/MocA family protein n=1 Tax=Paenibacillus provencensis TaxID=441151 RepID=A0ABW3PRF9_9BACL|nr:MULTISPECIES: Gfo/Idh/MocA family oxidoreductase [unclassified Paenibacillus]MCM3128568.1 Gfo/Idh/MocA family oxidoreductase [Paenibacillus sp. MER 78]SFS77499.1 Predicted dehydrogenase [Paenibacillus sp. 453mf]
MSKHKIIVAGCGGMSNTWLDYAAEREDAEIVGLVDLYEDSAKKMAERRNLQVPTFTELSAALQATDANLVFDCTIPASHKEIVTRALKAGCDVFGEKPMAESFEDAKEIVSVSNETGKRYSVMQNRRYLKQIRTLRDFVHSGKIGQLGSIHADFFLGPRFGGFRDLMNSPLIVDMAIHTFDQARFITGAKPVSVYCHEYNPEGSWYQGNASAICIFEMSDGSVFSYRGSWSAIGLNTSWEADWRVIGSQGSARWDGIRMPVGEYMKDEGGTGFFHDVEHIDLEGSWTGREGHAGCLDEMFLALSEGRPAETDCTDNIYSMAMVFGAVESANTGNKVYL